jgi:glucokinase
MSLNTYAGVDVGGTYTKIGLLGQRGRLVAKDQIPSEGFSNKKFFADQIKKGLVRLCRAHGRRWVDIQGVGIGLPGPVDTDRGMVLSLTNIKKWDRFPLAASLGCMWGKSVFLDNDANCMALAEARLGAARGARTALCVTLGTGVGAGLIIEGRIYHGPFFLGGEVGHIPIVARGIPCACGGVGCLERYVGNSAILRRARRLLGPTMTLEKASALAHRGNPKARRLWQETGEMIGWALAGVVNTVNPQVIVIGGGVANAGSVLTDAIARVVRRHAMKQIKQHVRVKKALLGNDAGVIGAALLVKS